MHYKSKNNNSWKVEEQLSNINPRNYFKNFSMVIYIYVLSMVSVILIALQINVNSVALLYKKQRNIYNINIKSTKLS